MPPATAVAGMELVFVEVEVVVEPVLADVVMVFVSLVPAEDVVVLVPLVLVAALSTDEVSSEIDGVVWVIAAILLSG